MCLPGQTLSRNRKRGKILTLNTINDLFSSVRMIIYFLAVQIKYSLISEASLGSVFSGAWWIRCSSWKRVPLIVWDTVAID